MHPYREPSQQLTHAPRKLAPLQDGDLVRVTLDERRELRGRTGEVGIVVMLSGELHAIAFRDGESRFYRRVGLQRLATRDQLRAIGPALT